jgi:hypothetical protein
VIAFEIRGRFTLLVPIPGPGPRRASQGRYRGSEPPWSDNT